ncbi:hypothetical protein [Cribrihabitans neustonicus]|uniref:hypothetical protein n=1 Tax=Cribrihabitans neustonicus TaxID=1429085 RepID=UPI003B5B993E
MLSALMVFAISIILLFALNILISAFLMVFAIESELVEILLSFFALPLAPFFLGSMALIAEQMWVLCGVYRIFGVHDLPVRRAVRKYALKG